MATTYFQKKCDLPNKSKLHILQLHMYFILCPFINPIFYQNRTELARKNGNYRLPWFWKKIWSLFLPKVKILKFRLSERNTKFTWNLTLLTNAKFWVDDVFFQILCSSQKVQTLWKGHIFWQNSCFYSAAAASKQVGDFFQNVFGLLRKVGL